MNPGTSDSPDGEFLLTHSFDFSAAHSIPGYPQPTHGHNWEVTVAARGNAEELDEYGFLIDFYDLQDLCSELYDRYDHTELNELPEFEETPPSAEHVAREIFSRLREPVAELGAELRWVEVTEVSGFTVRYTPGG